MQQEPTLSAPGRITPLAWAGVLHTTDVPRLPASVAGWQYCAEEILMRVVVNSDILYQGHPMVMLPERLGRLAEACRDGGHAIVLPETALLEFNRKQGALVGRAEEELRSAYAALDKHGIDHASPDPAQVVSAPDLPALLGATGVPVEVDVPTLDDQGQRQSPAVRGRGVRALG
jgi:hypothetical protein